MFSNLSKAKQDSLFLALIIILTVLFLILKIKLIWAELPQNIIPWDIMKWNEPQNILLGTLNILPFYSQYMYSLLLVAKCASKFVINHDIYTMNARQSTNLYLPSVNHPNVKKVLNMGIKIVNYLPWHIRKLLYDVNKFKVVTKKFFMGIFLLNKWILWVVW
jgi:hypothetical protein